MTIDMLFALGVIIAFLSGTRSTWRLWRRYTSARVVLLEPRERLILRSFVIVSVMITVAAGYFGFVALRRMLGYDPLDWTPTVSVLLAIVILFIPTMLDLVVARVARR